MLLGFFKQEWIFTYTMLFNRCTLDLNFNSTIEGVAKLHHPSWVVLAGLPSPLLSGFSSQDSG